MNWPKLKTFDENSHWRISVCSHHLGLQILLRKQAQLAQRQAQTPCVSRSADVGSTLPGQKGEQTNAELSALQTTSLNHRAGVWKLQTPQHHLWPWTVTNKPKVSNKFSSNYAFFSKCLLREKLRRFVRLKSKHIFLLYPHFLLMPVPFWQDSNYKAGNTAADLQTFPHSIDKAPVPSRSIPKRCSTAHQQQAPCQEAHKDPQ